MRITVAVEYLSINLGFPDINIHMRINEIILNPSQDDFPHSYDYHFKNVIDQHAIPLTPKFEFRAAIDETGFHMGIWNDDALVSYCSLHQEPFGWQVDKITTNHKYRSRGLIRYSIEYATKKFHKVYSDYHQTPEAATVWRALIKYRNCNSYYLFDVAENKLADIKFDVGTNSILPDPWNDSDNFIICAIHDPSRHTINEQRIEFNRIRKRTHPMMGDNFTEFNP